MCGKVAVPALEILDLRRLQRRIEIAEDAERMVWISEIVA